ncbi:MarR family winged helix-turn-helix transcriptional regulator [Paenibacillus sp. GCM10028914]|uniref:MarR family winged helix-turn-helix transcriptional regulator n=1 Tax=Paenibacillus sp. GCM10028914 TaxID=3273416 RepID=UPI003621E622
MVESEIRILLQNIAIQTRKKYAQQLRELGLHIGQELALFHLWEQDGIPQSQLRNKMGVEASTISNMLRRLEQDHIVYRKQDESDQRISNVYLTNKGQQLQGPVEEIWKEHELSMFRGIPSEELMLMRRILKQMEENLEG